MGEVIDLAARRRLKEIQSSVCFIGEQRVDPIDEELNRQFVEAQRRAMERVKVQATELCDILERIRDVCREAQKEAESDGPPTTP